MRKELIEGEDFYYAENGYIIFTEKYHKERGYCCGSGCSNCPFEYINVPHPKRNELLSLKNEKENKHKK